MIAILLAVASWGAAPAAPATPAAATSEAKPAEAVKPADAAKPADGAQPADAKPADAADAKPADDAKAGPRKLVAVLDLKVEGDAQALANALGTVMASEISSRAGYKAVSRNELKALLAHTADAAMLGCDSPNCAADIAKLADANLVITGTLGQVIGGEAGPSGKALVLTLSLIDPTGPAVVQRVDVTWRGDPEELVTVMPPTLDRLFDGSAAASYLGGVEIFAPEGVTLSVDGKEAGTSPLKAPLQGLAIGVHTIEASSSGYVPLKKDVVVSRGETTVTRLLLEEEPYYTQWWFWTAVGGGAAVAIAGGTAVALATLQPAAIPPTRIVVKTNLPSTSAAAE